MNRIEQFPEIKEIADAVCSEQATPEQFAQLEQLLTGDFSAQQFYYDYINMHMHLKAPADSSTEVIYRRMTERMTEEVVVRPTSKAPIDDVIDTKISDQPQPKLPAFSNKPVSWFLLVFIGLVLLFVWRYNTRTVSPIIGRIVEGQLMPFTQQGAIERNALLAGDYHTEQGATIQLVNGNIIRLAENTLLKLFNNKEVKLKRGKITLEPLANHNTIVHNRNFIALTNGAGLTFDLTQATAQLTSGESTYLIPRRWRPIHYWGFDGQTDRAVDTASAAHGMVAQNTKRIDGHIGQGAFDFDNSDNARIDLGSGGGTAPGTGSFAANDGITIEAFIKPVFSDLANETEDIFNKGQGEQGSAISLSFVHQKISHSKKMQQSFLHQFTFGLYIIGQGYQELKLMLDGQAGRPSANDIYDGNFHHIVASYDVKSGRKAIYIDGVQLARYQYPPGSKLLSGGAEKATIGNQANRGQLPNTAFSGAIDEVAFYDFALPEYTVQQHLKYTQQGLNYFGLPAKPQQLPSRPKMLLPANTTFELDALTGLPVKALAKND